MKKLALASGLFVALIACHARAAIPAGYTGTPFKGTPSTIPGRIDFENFDEGGMNVAWRVDDHTGNFGEGGCAANNYRTDLPHPQLCLTNNATEIDTYTAGPLMGQKYPSDAMPQSIYIGYTHGVDWVKLTVNVATAGTYKLSSTWGSEPSGPDAIKFQISFNDVLKADVMLPGTGGYHNWVASPDFATMELEAGVQVLQFAAKSQHLNYDYIQFSRVLPGGGVDDGSMGASGGSGTGGSASGGAATAGAAGTATAGAGGAAGSTGTAGTSVIGTDPFPTAGTGTGTAGSGTATGTAGSVSSAGSTGIGLQGTNTQQDSSCSVGTGRRGASSLAWLLAAGGALGAVARRRARRATR